MGADGGIVIYKYEEIKNNWNEIKPVLVNEFLTNEEFSWYFTLNSIDNYNYVQKIIDIDITVLTCNEFCKWFREEVWSNCDTPFAIDNWVVFPYGDNVPNEISVLEQCFYRFADNYTYETWT